MKTRREREREIYCLFQKSKKKTATCSKDTLMISSVIFPLWGHLIIKAGPYFVSDFGIWSDSLKIIIY